MPRLKYDKDTLQRMLTQVEKTKKEDTTRSHAVEANPSNMLKRVSQHCLRCGKVTVFSIDDLGYATCSICRSVAPDRHSSLA